MIIPTEVALLEAICNDLADDTVRLAYADWLDEHPLPDRDCACVASGYANGDTCNGRCCGTGVITNSSRADLAEFIRVQCERAAYNNRGVKGLFISDMDRMRELRTRESALLAANPAWRTCPCPACGGRGGGVYGQEETEWDCDLCRKSGDLFHGFAPVLRRGFVASLTVPTMESVAKWGVIGCGNCNSRGCPDCDDQGSFETWELTPWLRAVLAACPTLEGVRVADRVPTLDEGGYEWYDLPDPLNTPLTKQTFPTPDAATDALARTIVLFGKGTQS